MLEVMILFFFLLISFILVNLFSFVGLNYLYVNDFKIFICVFDFLLVFEILLFICLLEIFKGMFNMDFKVKIV